MIMITKVVIMIIILKYTALPCVIMSMCLLYLTLLEQQLKQVLKQKYHPLTLTRYSLCIHIILFAINFNENCLTDEDCS